MHILTTFNLLRRSFFLYTAKHQTQVFLNKNNNNLVTKLILIRLEVINFHNIFQLNAYIKSYFKFSIFL